MWKFFTGSYYMYTMLLLVHSTLLDILPGDNFIVPCSLYFSNFYMEPTATYTAWAKVCSVEY